MATVHSHAHDKRAPTDAKRTHGAHAPYTKLAIMAAVSFVSMYVLMYAMVDRLENVHPSLNQAYMAGLMTMPMLATELVLMFGMYPSRKVNAATVAAAAIGLVALWAAIRGQAFVDDESFLRAMIPHHAGAILMCKESSITGPDLRALCGRIVKGQQQEIEEMNAMLQRRSRD